MAMLQELLQELNNESVITRKMLERIPADAHAYQPHAKSMTISQLAGHIAELPQWVSLAFDTDGIDFATSPYTPPVWNDNAELLAFHEQNLKGAQASLENASAEDLLPDWVLRNGEQVLLTVTKAGMVRHAFSQIIHHRAQLGVYLRLLDVPIPGTYGPSADEQHF
ncbi:DinB family protein [Pedobacter sp. AW31-3R]|uniref:DinB family protein n=1 Tax=Pedobacter sp. AW31-3R TaxID=3445781 RepID=UPI003FA16ACE